MRISELTNTIKPKSPMTPAQAQVAGLKRNVEQDKLRLQQARERQRQQRSAEQQRQQRQRVSQAASQVR
jgi:hypothetical protein